MVIIINFADSDFSMYIMEAAKKYCDKYNTLVEYWNHYNNNSSHIEKLVKIFSDPKHIKSFFVKQVAGDWIKNLDDEEVLDTKMFEHILKYSKEMFREDDFTVVSNSEFDESELGYCEYLVLFFENDSLSYNIY